MGPPYVRTDTSICSIVSWAMGVGELVWIWKWLPLCTFATPRSRFDSVVVDGLGGFVSFFVAVLNVRGHPLRGGWSHSPPVGKGAGDVDDDVLCAGGWVVAVLNVVATPLGGAGPTLPLWGRTVTKMMMSLVCEWVGKEGGFVLR